MSDDRVAALIEELRDYRTRSAAADELVAVRDIGGKPCFVMFNTILRHALSLIELRKSIFTIGERANRVAQQLQT